MTHERMIADLEYYSILEKQIQAQKSIAEGADYVPPTQSREFEELTQQNLKFCKEALELFTIEEQGFSKKIAIPFGQSVTLVKEKVGVDGKEWKSQIKINCLYAEGEGVYSLEDKGTVSVDLVVRSDTSLKPMDNAVIDYMAYDADEQIFGFILSNKDSDEKQFLTIDCHDVSVVFGEPLLKV